jgi:RNA polymerase sigma-70 factor (ECF subfamily)
LTREDKLIRKIKQGDADALDELIRMYYPEILKYCLWHAPGRELAEDAAQETFLKMIRYMDAYHGRGKFRAFLYKIAANTCIDMRRKKWLSETCVEDMQEELSYQEIGFEQADEYIQLMQMIRTVKPEWQELLVLRFVQNLTLREITEVTGIPLRTVQSRLRLALQQLKKDLRRGGSPFENGNTNSKDK